MLEVYLELSSSKLSSLAVQHLGSAIFRGRS